MDASADIGEMFINTRYFHPVGQRFWRKRALSAMLGLGAVIFMAPTHAGAGTDPGGPTITPAQAKLAAPFVDLGAMESLEGDDLEAFVLRAGGVLHDFTQSTGHEACGVLLVDADDAEGIVGPWKVRLTTNRSHIACVLVEYIEDGYRRLGPGMHSHPYLPEGFTINPQDERWRKPQCKTQDDKCQAMLEAAPRCGDDWRVHDGHFSARDFAHGPGYLVARGQLLYQKGEGYPIRWIGSVDETLPHSLSFGGGEVERQRMTSAAVAAWQVAEDDHIPAIKCSGPGSRYSRP